MEFLRRVNGRMHSEIINMLNTSVVLNVIPVSVQRLNATCRQRANDIFRTPPIRIHMCLSTLAHF
jgi:hypothetical protein